MTDKDLGSATEPEAPTPLSKNFALVRQAIGLYEDQSGDTQRFCAQARAALDDLQYDLVVRIERERDALFNRRRALRVENRKLLAQISAARDALHGAEQPSAAERPQEGASGEPEKWLREGKA